MLRMPREPKLRSSCDACGAAKLKCDRGQAECGRCLSLGLQCVYGVSRKMGKPPRERLLKPGAPSPSLPSGEPSHSHEMTGNSVHSDDIAGFNSNGIALYPRLLWSVNNMNLATNTADGYLDSAGPNVDMTDALQSDLFGSMVPDLTSLDFGDALSNIDIESMSTMTGLDFEGFLAPTVPIEAAQPNSKNHHCFREAYDILGSLAFHGLNDAQSGSRLPADSASTTSTIANQASFDRVLLLNREASERLGRLFIAYSTRSPHVVLLYASIISQVLLRYQQASNCTQGASWTPIDMSLDLPSHNMSMIGSSPSSNSGSSGGSSNWSSTAARSTPTSTQSPGVEAGPGKMTIGTFNVDDLSVQTALKIQLLLGEMRRAGGLIDQFASHNSSDRTFTDEYTFSGVNSLNALNRNLDSWLRGEHTRIANMMRSKLGELNT